MGTKRPHSDLETGHEARSHSGAGQRPPPTKRHKNAGKSAGDAQDSQAASFNGVKKRARTIERRLKRKDDSMPANVQKDLERELASLKQRIADHDGKKQRNTMIKRYHMVRFFERKKAQRLEKRLRQKLQAATDREEVASLEADLHVARVDINYAIYFPFMERYVSLYPASAKADKTGNEEGETTAPAAMLALRSERPPLWRVVEEAMEEGPHALLKLQNRQTPAEPRSSKPQAETPSNKRRPNAKDSGTEKANSKSGDLEKAASERRSTDKSSSRSRRTTKERPKKEPVVSTSDSSDGDSDDDDGFGKFFSKS